jgi:rhodanese-related sulfurtransferase
VIAAIDVDQLAERLASGGLTADQVVDVREVDEYEQAHIPGVRLMPMSSITEHLDELKAINDLTVVCAAGGRSHRVCEWLESHGVEATNVLGGTGGWIAAGHPVDRGVTP